MQHTMWPINTTWERVGLGLGSELGSGSELGLGSGSESELGLGVS